MRRLIRRLLPTNVKRHLAKIVSNSMSGHVLGILYKNEIPFHGVIVDTSDKDSIRRKTVSDIFFKLYERAEIDQVREHLDGKFDVIELGGSIGINTMQICKKLKPNKRVFVVEALPKLVNVLRGNLRKNDLESKAMILNRAIDYSGSTHASFRIESSNLSGKVVDGTMDSSNMLKVRTTQLSSIIDEHQIEDYVLVSDIEGMEIPIFLEDQISLGKCQQIFLEIDGVSYKNVKYSIEEIISIINKLGFDTVEQYHNCVAFQRRQVSSSD